MKMTQFQQDIVAFLPDVDIKIAEPMSKHTSFRIGGPAEAMAFPKNVQQLSQILKVSKLLDCNIAILGAGTNVLAPDAGVSGLIVCLKDCFDGITQLDNNTICVSAGVTMSRAAVFAAGLGLGGMEFAHGIPGTVGGGVYMNAGAYGGEIAQICQSVDVMTMDGEVITYQSAEMDFSYRHSRMEDEKGIVVSATFALEKKEESDIRAKMRELMKRRKATQPLDIPSAGSAFKRPVGGYAAALIEHAGLKGFQIGGAAISDKHAGFVVNLANASSNDVVKLLSAVSDKVFEESGIRLIPEIRIW